MEMVFYTVCAPSYDRGLVFRIKLSYKEVNDQGYVRVGLYDHTQSGKCNISFDVAVLVCPQISKASSDSSETEQRERCTQSDNTTQSSDLFWLLNNVGNAVPVTRGMECTA
jgi:hypothetical protein